MNTLDDFWNLDMNTLDDLWNGRYHVEEIQRYVDAQQRVFGCTELVFKAKSFLV